MGQSERICFFRPMIAKKVEHLINGTNIRIVEIVELKLSTIGIGNNPAACTMVDGVCAFANTCSGTRGVIIHANADALIDAFGADKLGAYKKSFMLKTPGRHLIFLRTFYIEYEVAIWRCFGRCG